MKEKDVKVRTNRKKRWWILLGAALLFCALILARPWEKKLPRERDREFAKGTPIRLEPQVSSQQEEALFKLCRVWGYAKYFHPSVIDGTLNWDGELFRIMPGVLEAQTPEEVNRVLYEWLAQFPAELPEAGETEKMYLELQKSEEAHGYETADTSWTKDEQELGKELSGYLQQLGEVYTTQRENSYLTFDENGRLVFQEQDLAFNNKDDGAKLLGLFRFWNIYEYFSPNLELTEPDWDTVLKKAIPQMLKAETYQDYVLVLAEMAARTHDAHISVGDRQGTLMWYYGKYQLQCRFKNVEGQVVVAALPKDEKGLKLGDIIIGIDGISIEERLETLSRYVVLPEKDKWEYKMSMYLLRCEEEQAKVQVIRDGREQEVSVTAKEEEYVPEKSYQTGLIENGQIGYIDPSVLKDEDWPELMESFGDTKGLVVDLRYYPTTLITYYLAEYINPERTQFVRMSFPNPVLPGSYYCLDEFYSGAGQMAQLGITGEFPLYEGEVIILIDENTASAGEFAAMSLRMAPKATVVGSPTLGADGDIALVTLPGNVAFAYSGFGVFTPEGGQTQRIGIQPDVECRSTLEGLQEGRDELMEKAVNLILG